MCIHYVAGDVLLFPEDPWWLCPLRSLNSLLIPESVNTSRKMEEITHEKIL